MEHDSESPQESGRGSDGQIRIGGIRLEDVATTFGTPLYVIDADDLTSRLRAVHAEFTHADVRLFYSIKANPNLAILHRCLEVGMGLDACSVGDVHLALSAGAGAEQISYTGTALRDAELQWLISLGVQLNLDSRSEMKRFAKLSPGRSVGVRIAPDIEAGFHPHCRAGLWGGKFGIDTRDLGDIREMMARSGCRVTRLHTHLGSSIPDTTPFLEALDLLLDLALDAPDVTQVNLGGGLAAQYHPDDEPFPLREFGTGITERVQRFELSTGRHLIVQLEPGELLISESVHLLCRATVTKHWSRFGDKRHVVIADASMNLLPAYSLYGTYFPIDVDGFQPTDAVQPYDIYGCTNQTGDQLCADRWLPTITEGNLLVIHNAGAYGYSRSTQFNERPRPAEIWIEDSQASLVREAETVDVLTRGQHIPGAAGHK